MADGPDRPAGPTGSPAPARDRRDGREILRLVVGLVGLVLLVAFVVGNSDQVRVNFVVTHARVSLIWVILASALLGVLVDRLVIAVGRRRRRKR